MKENLLAAGGAWAATFTALAPYRPVFLAIAVTCLGAGLVLRR